jgi:hypothetical protein
MSEEPVRFKDSADAPVALRDLLRKGADVPPMPADVRAAVRASLPGAPAPAPPPKGLLASPAVIGGGAVVIVAVVAAIVWLTRPTPPSPAPAPSLSAPASSSAVIEERDDSTESIDASPAASASATGSMDGSKSASARPSARPSASASTTDTLAEELLLIEKARGGLDANPTVALASIDEHARRFPRGQLAPEREYLRLRALRRMGRVDEAKTRARAYLTSFPSSPHAAAVRQMLSELEAR